MLAGKNKNAGIGEIPAFLSDLVNFLVNKIIKLSSQLLPDLRFFSICLRQ